MPKILLFDLYGTLLEDVCFLSNSGFRGGALRKMLDSQGIDRFFEEVWSSADFVPVTPRR